METPIAHQQPQTTSKRGPEASKPFLLARHNVTVKLVGIILLIMLLLIPLGMISSLVRERMGRRDSAVRDIYSSWGKEQVIVGPVISVPYRYTFKTQKERYVEGEKETYEVEETAVANAFFLPDSLNIESVMEPKMLHRGIYDAVVYSGTLDISGQFSRPDFSALQISESDVIWGKACVAIAVSDLRGTGTPRITMATEELVLKPGYRLTGYDTGISADLKNLRDLESEIPFELKLDIKGSKGIRFAPLGQTNRVKMVSAWSAPSFQGDFLPSERAQLDKKGFDVTWDVSWYGRNYPQQSKTQDSNVFQQAAVAPSLFGVDFLDLVDSYRMVERATKYGVLFIALIFTAFFLFEVLSALGIHPIQYLLVGAALCLFYLALLSLSEFIAFGPAYWIGAVASSLLIVLYSKKVLKNGVRSAAIGAALLGIYAYLYVILQLQDYLLLFGTAALFIALAVVMYATRNLDWSKPVQEK